MIAAVITARANSKGLPGKNMLDLGGFPLIEHTYRTAVMSSGFDRVILNTDMDAAIELAAEKYPQIEIPFKRPAELSADTSTHAEVIDHMIAYFRKKGEPVKHLVILQPTSPFKTSEEMNRGAAMLKQGSESVLGVSKVMHHPAEYLYRGENGDLQFLMPEFKGKRRQEYPDLYFDNGAFYGFSIAYFEKNRCFFDEKSELLHMSEFALIDIDTAFEMAIARGLADMFREEYENV